MFSDTKKELIEFCISLQVAKVRSVRRRNVDRDVITGCVEAIHTLLVIRQGFAVGRDFVLADIDA